MNHRLAHDGYDQMLGSDSLGWQRPVRPVSCDVSTNICTYHRPPELPTKPNAAKKEQTEDDANRDDVSYSQRHLQIIGNA